MHDCKPTHGLHYRVQWFCLKWVKLKYKLCRAQKPFWPLEILSSHPSGFWEFIWHCLHTFKCILAFITYTSFLSFFFTKWKRGIFLKDIPHSGLLWNSWLRQIYRPLHIVGTFGDFCCIVHTHTHTHTGPFQIYLCAVVVCMTLGSPTVTLYLQLVTKRHTALRLWEKSPWEVNRFYCSGSVYGPPPHHNGGHFAATNECCHLCECVHSPGRRCVDPSCFPPCTFLMTFLVSATLEYHLLCFPRLTLLPYFIPQSSNPVQRHSSLSLGGTDSEDDQVNGHFSCYQDECKGLAILKLESSATWE